MRYRIVFHFFYLGLTALWIVWCLYWPFYARRLDLESVSMEVRETYQVCLQQPGASKGDCLGDRAFNQQFENKLIAPPGRNAYQSFAGGSAPAVISTISALCIGPPLLLYPFIRGIAAIIARIHRR